MKRYGYLFEHIVSFENLLIAARKAFRGKKHRADVSEFYFYMEKELLKLQEELTLGTYCLQPYYTFNIYEPKERKICASSFRDRVVHHAICNVIGPVFEKSLIFDTYACRNNKGTHRAVARVRAFARKHPYFLKCDIKKFFESIDHKVLKELMRKKFKDKRLLNLLDLIIDHSVPGYARGKGLPIGNLTSQDFANYYLSGLDRFIKEELQVKGYVRYMDDFIIFEKEKTVLREILIKICYFLKENFLLSIKEQGLILAPSIQGI